MNANETTCHFGTPQALPDNINNMSVHYDDGNFCWHLVHILSTCCGHFIDKSNIPPKIDGLYSRNWPHSESI